jgi:hypothetical protein
LTEITSFSGVTVIGSGVKNALIAWITSAAARANAIRAKIYLVNFILISSFVKF